MLTRRGFTVNCRNFQEAACENPAATPSVLQNWLDTYALIAGLSISPASSWYRIMPAATPWITTGNAFEGKPKAFYRAIFFKCFQPVLAAGRGISTAGTK